MAAPISSWPLRASSTTACPGLGRKHDPLELLANVERCLEATGRVDAIGLANQGESCLAWDAITGEPLSPVIVWQDNAHALKSSAPRAPKP